MQFEDFILLLAILLALSSVLYVVWATAVYGPLG